MNRVFFAVIALAAFPSLSAAQARHPEPEKRRDTYSLTNAEEVPIPAKRAKLPLVIFGEEPGTASGFIPSGYMGDAEVLTVKNGRESAPVAGGRTGQVALRIEYKGELRWGNAPVGHDGWAGVYWLTPANNWGKIKGAGYDLSKAKRCRFWLKGAAGGEVIAQIKVGGLTGPYGDTDSIAIGPVTLSNKWESYTIDLTGKDLRHIVGGFMFVLRRSDNPRGAEFLLDEIAFDGGDAPGPPVSASRDTPAPSGATPAALADPVTFVLPLDGVGWESNNDLQKISGLLNQYPSCRLRISGHTDSVGSAEANERLASQRARAVFNYFKATGIPEERMTVSSVGEGDPVADNETPEGRTKNRRVEVTVTP